MENLGYKEGFANRPRRSIRGASLTPKTEELPLIEKQTRPTHLNLRINQPNFDLDSPSEALEYVEIGPTPEAEGVPCNYDYLEEESVNFSDEICSDTIRMNLMDQMASCNGSLKILEDIENGIITLKNLDEHFEGLPLIEKNTCFLWTAFVKRSDLLEGLLHIGSELNFCDAIGISALHLSAFSGCLRGTKFLISKGLDVNLQDESYSPLHCAAFGNATETARLLIDHGADIKATTKNENLEESPLHCAVRANAIDCLKLFISKGANVNLLSPNGTNPIHLASDLGYSKCLEVLLSTSDADPNIRIFKNESTALHLAADEGNSECVNLLLLKGADAKLKNHRGLTALHLAARTSTVEGTEELLRLGGADPNAEDFDRRTPLHAAVNKSETAFQILEALIDAGADVNRKDVYGLTALHLAALEGLSPCVEMLMFHGTDVSIKSKKGISTLNVINRKTPNSVKMLDQLLDSSITCHFVQEGKNRELELELDFGSILQHCHPREMGYLNLFVQEGQKELLEHPLCRAFLYKKWEKIRKYYIARLVSYFVLIMFLTLYVMSALAHNCYNEGKEGNENMEEQKLCQKESLLGTVLRKNPFVIEMQWWVLVAITGIEIFRKLLGIPAYDSFKEFFFQVENVMDWFIILSVFVISYVYTNRTYIWQNHFGAFAVLVGWTNLMLMVGQLPAFGSYVAMYTKVQKEFGKLIIAYLCMLFGFTFTFCVVFPDNPTFANPFIGFITVLQMMVGEQDFTIVANEPDGVDPPYFLEISAQIIYVLFVIFVTVILMNLLNGIAIDDIQGLRKTAALSKLVRQTVLITYIESALFKIYLPSKLKKILHKTALVSPQGHNVVMCVRPLNPAEKRLPPEILEEVYKIGIQKKNVSHTVSPTAFKTNINSEDQKSNQNHFSNNEKKQSDNKRELFQNLTSTVNYHVEKIEQLRNEVENLKALASNNNASMERIIALASTLHLSAPPSRSNSRKK